MEEAAPAVIDNGNAPTAVDMGSSRERPDEAAKPVEGSCGERPIMLSVKNRKYVQYGI